MTTTYPGTLSSFSNPSGSSPLNSPDHAAQHEDINDTMEAVQGVLGTTAGTSVLKDFSAGHFPVRVNGSNVLQQILSGTLNNSVFGTPSITGGTVANSLVGTSTITGGTISIGEGTLSSVVINNPTIGTPALTGGTVANALIGTSQHTGGTVTGAVIGTNSIVGGTISSALIGTSQHTGGTVTGAVVGTNTITGGTISMSVGTLNNMVMGSPTVTSGTLTNSVLNTVTLGTPTITVGSDATGDMFYRSSGGTITRLGIGTSGQVITTDGTTPSWGAAASSGVGTVATGNGLIGGPITSTGTVSIGLWTGWQAASETWSATGIDSGGRTGTVVVAADVTAKYSQGMKLSFTQGGTAMYGFISNVPAVASGTTTITIYTGTAYLMGTTAITNNQYSTMHSPQGFPLNPTFWTVETVGTTNASQASPGTGVWYNVGGSISIPIGLWRINYQATPYCASGTASGRVFELIDVTLSTGTATESDSDFTAEYYQSPYSGGNVIDIQGFVAREKYIILTSKTPYYLNIYTTVSGMGAMALRGDRSKTIIRATSAFL